jgi:hypothetical protein
MTILKLALLGALRIAFLGSLKLALFVYTLFLADTSFAGSVTKGNDQVGDTASYDVTESSGNGIANIR